MIHKRMRTSLCKSRPIPHLELCNAHSGVFAYYRIPIPLTELARDCCKESLAKDDVSATSV